MSDTEYELERPDQQSVSEQGGRAVESAVGVVATGDGSEGVAATILRAQRHELDVFVTYTPGVNEESLKFARQLGASVIDPAETSEESTTTVNNEQCRQLLAGAAEARGHSTLLFVAEPNRRVDFEESQNRQEGLVSDVVYESQDHGGESTVVVGIPAYNEAETIVDIIAEAQTYADTVLVVDDGSDDGTAARARGAGAVVVEHGLNQGYGAALKTLFTEAANRNVEYLTIIDADGQHDPDEIPELVAHQRETEAELVIGSRFADGGETNAPLYRRFGLGIVNVLTNLSMGVVRPSSAVADTQSGFRVYNQTAIESLAGDDSIGAGMNASTDILYHAHTNNFEITEVGTHIEYDVDNASSQGPLSHGMTLLNNILKTIERERPILVLGIPGLILTMTGLFMGYWTLSNYISTGTFPVGRAVSSALFGLAGTFSVFTAIILHALSQHFETY